MGFVKLGGFELRDKATTKTTAKAIDQSFRLRLHSSLRQSGNAFGVVFVRRAEALRFRSKCIDLG